MRAQDARTVSPSVTLVIVQVSARNTRGQQQQAAELPDCEQRAADAGYRILASRWLAFSLSPVLACHKEPIGNNPDHPGSADILRRFIPIQSARSSIR